MILWATPSCKQDRRHASPRHRHPPRPPTPSFCPEQQAGRDLGADCGGHGQRAHRQPQPSCGRAPRRHLRLFELSTIRLLLADREFIGRDWIDFLCENNIPFAIRLRGDLRITTEENHELTLDARLHWRRRARVFTGWLGAGEDRGRHRLSFTAKPLANSEWLIVATNRAPRLALIAYRKRWAIECLFGGARTRGLNLEDTRLTDPRKLDLLMGLVALAIAWVAHAARDLLGARWPRRKSHGYLEKSWFRTGFDQIRHRLRSDPIKAIDPWRCIEAKRSKIHRVV